MVNLITQYIFIFVTSFFSFLFLIKSKNTIENFSNPYNSLQKIHIDYVPPLGGLVIFCNFFLYLLIWKSNSFFLEYSFLISSFLIIIVGTQEDLFLNVKPKVRFITLFIASLIFILNCESLPKIDIIIISNLFTNFPFLEILFYAFCLTTISNGLNMIDGMNGLAGFASLSIIIGLISLLMLTDGFENFLREELILIFILLIIFLFFNFPIGKIFLGDAGAYWLGWLLGAIVIKVFTIKEINTWIAVLLVFYPTCEVIFSTIRKLMQKKNPLNPDLEHIHLKLYYILKGPTDRNKSFNSFTTLCLMPLWFSPSVLIIWGYYFSHLALIGVILMTCVYILFYVLIPKKQK